MGYKRVDLPLKSHLIKFVKKEYEMRDDVLILSRKRLLRPSALNPSVYKHYFMSTAIGLPTIRCDTIDSKLYKLYYFIHHLEDRFNEKMCDFVEVRMNGVNMNAKESILIFLDKYEITESEYSWGTAYKRWQRSLQYQLVKEQQQLKKLSAKMCDFVMLEILEEDLGPYDAIRKFMKLHGYKEYRIDTLYRRWLRSAQCIEVKQLIKENDCNRKVA